MTSGAQAEQTFPRGVLIASALLLAFVIAAAGFGRATRIGTVALDESVAWESIRIRFEDRTDGAVVVLDDATGAERARIAAGEGGFVRGVLRGLARERALSGIGSAPPFELTRWQDGRLSLTDLATGRRIEIDAFGPDNVASFRRLLTAQGSPIVSHEGASNEHPRS
ncbi:MAG: photosynthetic complex assembly protein PuhC [Myxococcota bacterium]